MALYVLRRFNKDFRIHGEPKWHYFYKQDGVICYMASRSNAPRTFTESEAGNFTVTCGGAYDEWEFILLSYALRMKEFRKQVPIGFLEYNLDEQ